MENTSTTENTETEEKKEVIAEQPAVEKKEEGQEEDPTERNWKAVREKRKKDKEETERLEKANREQAAMIEAMTKAMERSSQPQQQTPTHQQATTPNQIHDTEWITGKQYKEMQAADKAERDKEKADNEKERKKIEADRAQSDLMARLHKDIPDFLEVLTDENIEYLKTYNPREAETIKHINDPYYQTVDAYNKIKQLVPQMTDLDKKKMARAENTPNSISQQSGGYGVTQPNTSTRRLSDQQKKDMWREMKAAARG